MKILIIFKLKHALNAIKKYHATTTHMFKLFLAKSHIKRKKIKTTERP